MQLSIQMLAVRKNHRRRWLPHTHTNEHNEAVSTSVKVIIITITVITRTVKFVIKPMEWSLLLFKRKYENLIARKYLLKLIVAFAIDCVAKHTSCDNVFESRMKLNEVRSIRIRIEMEHISHKEFVAIQNASNLRQIMVNKMLNYKGK